LNRTNYKRSFKGAQTTHSQTSRGLVALTQHKNKKKEKILVEKKEKILTKLVVEKENKGFDTT
jgi:hypothetical protein